MLCEEPALIEKVMGVYADYMETLIPKVLADVDVDYAVMREPVASNHGPVVSPEMYARFAGPALRRITDCLERHGVEFRAMWSAGAVGPLVSTWMDEGINGLFVNQAGQAGLRYGDLRRRFGTELRLFGGIDWRAVVKGPTFIEAALECDIRPLLEQGGYIPYLDDTVRTYMPFDCFRYYRESLDALLDEVYA
jgi:uroporphyrinogen decarboxylase